MRVLIYILIMWAVVAKALPSNWVFGSGGEIHQFSIDIRQLYFNKVQTRPNIGDAIAVFEVNGSVEKCRGYVVISDTTSDSTVTAYSGAKDTFALTNSYVFKYWDSRKDCQRVLMDTISGKTLKNGAYTDIRLLQSLDLSVSYPSNIIYTDETSFSPSVTNQSFPLTFKALDSALYLDTLKGTISPSRSLVGIYTIQFKTVGCMVSSQIDTIEIKQRTLVVNKDSFDIKKVEFKAIQPTCSQNGSIVLSNQVNDTITFAITNIITKDTVSSATGSFMGLKDGTYSIRITKRTYGVDYPDLFTLLTNCENIILDLSNHQNIKTIIIDKQGMSSIYNREGVRVKSLQAPAEWDATDQSGNALPMGDYYVFVNNEKYKVITIIR